VAAERAQLGVVEEISREAAFRLRKAFPNVLATAFDPLGRDQNFADGRVHRERIAPFVQPGEHTPDCRTGKIKASVRARRAHGVDKQSRGKTHGFCAVLKLDAYTTWADLIANQSVLIEQHSPCLRSTRSQFG